MPIDYQRSQEYKDKVDDRHPDPVRERPRISPADWLDTSWTIDPAPPVEQPGLRNQTTYSAVYERQGTQYVCTITEISTYTEDVQDIRIYDSGFNPWDHQTRIHRELLERAQLRDTPGAIGQTLLPGLRDLGR